MRTCICKRQNMAYANIMSLRINFLFIFVGNYFLLFILTWCFIFITYLKKHHSSTKYVKRKRKHNAYRLLFSSFFFVVAKGLMYAFHLYDRNETVRKWKIWRFSIKIISFYCDKEIMIWKQTKRSFIFTYFSVYSALITILFHFL